jgi:ATP-dependent protease ClpP protease subunit
MDTWTVSRAEIRAAADTWGSVAALRRLYPSFRAFLAAAAIGRGADARTSNAMRLALCTRQLEDAARWAAERLAAIRAPEAAAAFEIADPGARVLWLYGKIDAVGQLCESAVAGALDRMEAGPLKVRLSSFGGNPSEARRIARTLRESGRRTSVLIDHAAWSAATLIAAAGCHCAMRAGATWMLHPSKSETWNTAAGMRRDARRLELADEQDHRYIAARRRMPLRAVRRLSRGEQFIEAAEALRLGLIDEILPALPPPGELESDT